MITLKNTSARIFTFVIDPPTEGREAHISTAFHPGESKVITLKQLDMIRSTVAGKAIVENEDNFRIYGEEEDRKAQASTAEEYVSQKKK